MLGRYDLSAIHEAGSRNFSVWEIILHPYWRSNEKSFEADVAVVVLEQKVEFSDVIKPVNLPKANDYNEPVGCGVVVGWRKRNKFGYIRDTFPKELTIPIVKASHCQSIFPQLIEFASDSSFCGGYKNSSSSMCLGDTSSGIYFKDSTEESWNVGGFISATPLDKHDCDINKYSLYTNLARFTDWINTTIHQTMDIVWKPVNFTCSES